MAYGLRVKNDDAEIQIDGTYRNMALETSGDALDISNAGGSDNYYETINITASSRPPLIALRPDTDYPVCMVGVGKTGANYDKFYLTTTTPQTTTIDWRCFRETPAKSAEDYGLRVYDASANLVYDSGKQYLKILQVTNIDIAAAWNSTQDVTHAGVSDPYYILSPQTLAIRTAAPSALWYVKAGIKQLTSTSVRVEWCPFGTQGGSYTDDWITANGVFKLIVCGLG